MPNLAAAAPLAAVQVNWAIVVLFALGAGGLWLLSVLVHPYTSCRSCNGTGRNAGSTGRAYGRCRSCGGKPERLRFSARLLGRGRR